MAIVEKTCTCSYLFFYFNKAIYYILCVLLVLNTNAYDVAALSRSIRPRSLPGLMVTSSVISRSGSPKKIDTNFMGYGHCKASMLYFSCANFKNITHRGFFNYIFNYESYNYALSRDMGQGALIFHGTSACTGRPFDG